MSLYRGCLSLFGSQAFREDRPPLRPVECPAYASTESFSLGAVLCVSALIPSFSAARLGRDGWLRLTPWGLSPYQSRQVSWRTRDETTVIPILVDGRSVTSYVLRRNIYRSFASHNRPWPPRLHRIPPNWNLGTHRTSGLPSQTPVDIVSATSRRKSIVRAGSETILFPCRRALTPTTSRPASIHDACPPSRADRRQLDP